MTPWVLLHGFARDSRYWGDFPSILRAARPDARVHLVDLPGSGRFFDEAGPMSVEAMARNCSYQLSRRGLKPPFNVIGFSLGGMVATAWAAEKPEEVAACVLVNTSLRPFSPGKLRLRSEHRRSLLRLLHASPAECEHLLMRLSSRQVAADADRRMERLVEWLRWREEMPVSTRNLLRQIVAAARFVAPRSAPVPDMLVLTSTQDALVDSRCSQQIAAAWGCEIAAHPEAGHDLPLDDGPWIAEQVLRWTSALIAADEPLVAPPVVDKTATVAQIGKAVPIRRTA